MKKVSTTAKRSENDNMRAEYDFTGGVRGKHYRAMQAGYTVTIHQADGATVTQEVKPKEGAVTLEPDVREYFPDSESVNSTLRSIIGLIPKKRSTVNRPSAAGGKRP
jgi:hypothetical protein